MYSTELTYLFRSIHTEKDSDNKMAASKPKMDNLNRLLECPICTDKFTDPRMLKCGHHFCLTCLINTMWKLRKTISCPLCRKITKIEKDVDSLPKPVLANHIQEQVSKLGTRQTVPPPKKPAKRESNRKPTCESCQRKAGHRCRKCMRNFCNICITQHQRVGHQTFPLSDDLFCTLHPEDMASKFCHDCDSGICEYCSIHEHVSHDHEDIQLLADKLRIKLLNASEKLNKGTVQHVMSENTIANQLKNLYQAENDFLHGADETTKAITWLQQAVDDVTEDYMERMHFTQEQLHAVSSDIATASTKWQEGNCYIEHLTEGQCNPRLVRKARELLDLGLPSETNFELGTPNFQGDWEEMTTTCQKWIHKCQTKTENRNIHLLGPPPSEDKADGLGILANLRKRMADYAERNIDLLMGLAFLLIYMYVVLELVENSFVINTIYIALCLLFARMQKHKTEQIETAPPPTPAAQEFQTDEPSENVPCAQPIGINIDINNLSDLIFDKAKRQLAVLTKGTNTSLKVYNYYGNCELEWDAGLGRRSACGLAMDTWRGLYMILCHNKLILVDRKGQMTKSMPVDDGMSVSYLGEEDLYVVNDTNTILTINPHLRKETLRFTPQTQQQKPGRLASVTTYRTNNQSVIAVTDWSMNQVKLFDTRGHHIKSYGHQRCGDGGLWHPTGVAAGPRGMVLVCDTYNKRVSSYWTVGNSASWGCVLTTAQLEGHIPQSVDYDPDSDMLAVGSSSRIKLIKFSKLSFSGQRIDM